MLYFSLLPWPCRTGLWLKQFYQGVVIAGIMMVGEVEGGNITRNVSMVEAILLLLCVQITDQKRTQIRFGASCGEGFRVSCSYSDLLLRWGSSH